MAHIAPGGGYGPAFERSREMGPLSEVEKWDLDDIRYFNSILDMRRDCEAAADAYQAMQMEQMRQANERRR